MDRRNFLYANISAILGLGIAWEKSQCFNQEERKWIEELF
jgi:hypothetical protein